MNRRLYVCIAALGLGLATSFASAQAVPTTNPTEVPHISTATRGSGAITPEQKQEIDTFVAAELNILKTGTIATRAGSKKAIIDEAPGTAGGLTPQYLDAYASVVDQHVTALLKSNPKLSLPLRINLGVIAAKVASNTNSSQLAGSADALLHDDAEAVVLWGMRTAKYVLPPLIKVQVGNKNTLLPLVVDTAVKYPGPVLIEGYQALTLEPLAIPLNARQFQAEIKAVIPFVQSVLNKRIQGFGQALPKEPVADTQGTTFLVNPNVWILHTQPQKKETWKVLHDLLAKSGPLYTAPNQELFLTLKTVASGAGVAAGKDDQAVSEAASKVSKATINDAPAKVSADVVALVGAIEAMPIMQTPAVQGGATSRPSSGYSPASDLAVIK